MFHSTLPFFHLPLLHDLSVISDPLFTEPCRRLNPLLPFGHGLMTMYPMKSRPNFSSPLIEIFSQRNHIHPLNLRRLSPVGQFSLPPHYFANDARCCPTGTTFNMAELFPVTSVQCPVCIGKQTNVNFVLPEQLHISGNTWKTMEAASTADLFPLKSTNHRSNYINHNPPLFTPTVPPWKSVEFGDSTTEIRNASVSGSGKSYPSLFPLLSLGKRRCIRCRCPNCMNPSSAATDRATGAKRKHICHFPGCRKIYGKTSHLRAHLRWHVGDRPFRCRWMFCRKSFTRSDELQRHLKTHTGDKKFLCRLCCKRFMRSDHLKKHLKTHQVRDTLAVTVARTR